MAATIQSEPPTDDRVLVFRGLRLDLAKRVLLQDGVPVLQATAQKTPRPLHVLIVLAQAKGQVVTKEKLFEVVWDDRLVTEKALTYAVNQLRAALKPHGDLLVENVPRVGYRLGGSWEPLRREIPDQAAVEPDRPTGPSIEDPQSRDIRVRALLALTVLCIVAALVMVAPSVGTSHAPRVLASMPLTFDGLRKFGPLLTDGKRIYFHLETPEGPRLVSIPATGGDATPVPTPVGDSAKAVAITANRRSLVLVKPDSAADAWFPWQWEIGTSIANQFSDQPVNEAAWQPNGVTVLQGAANRLTVLRSGAQTANFRIPGNVTRIQWSPSGKTARVFAFDPATERYSTWELNSPSFDHPVRQNAPINGARDGTWTSDERYFVFATNPSGELGWQREGAATAGRSSKTSGVLTTGGQTWSDPARGPTGNRIIALGEKLRGELVRFTSDGEFEPFLHGISAMELDFSRDGRQLVYSRFPDHALWIARADGTDARRLTEGMESRQPHFSPDGRTIAFMGQRPKDIWRIYSMQIGVSLPEPMFPDKEDQGVPTWSPNGKFLVFGEWRERKDKSAMALHLLNVEKKTVTTLPGSQGLWTPRWSPDGRYIAALTADSKALMLFDVHLATWVKLAPFGYFEDPTWTQDGRYICGHDQSSHQLYRVRLKDRSVEKVADLTGFTWAQQAWVGLTPGGIPIGLHGVVLQDIYALDCDIP
jgi:DNA-binding winged helix-turn-helix (wHTH) protein/Tol biopolymer transport system component